ncbi:salicylate synthase [Amycolatopsis decaplanina]|uniref:Anthranilate synthase component I n=1 Tax=Amycolatopsis decaplanina DSM 44594 TaxID=1284240 RepID=M2ZBI4_9PSEU|nr:salicylate synthase [Amycolatopsis decaplanina]EME57739.1 anthranilate synthase component I [Amycolatopsis decaplanina DSM 44594]
MGGTEWAQYVETSIEVAGDPLEVSARLAEAGPHGEFVIYEKDGHWSYAGGVLAEVTLDRNGARLGGVRTARLPWSDRPLRQVKELLGMVPVRGWRAYGAATFELSYAKDGDLEHVDDQPLLHLVVPKSEVRIGSGRAWVRSTDPDTLAVLVDLLGRPVEGRESDAVPLDVRQTGRDEYRAAVAGAVQDIADARLQKVILSRLVRVDEDIDLVGTYVLGRRRNTPARSFLVRLGGLEAAGFSPEIVVSVTEDGTVVSQPLAGTRALTSDAATNDRLRGELLSDEKEIYEHAISVKVGNDELLTVCEPDSVGVRNLMTLEERGSVQHIASRVTGRLSAGHDAWDAFAAVFPAVTASGVSKEAAYEAIRRYETERRGLYSGAVLTVDESGAMDAALVLRTVYRQDGRTWLRAGAGIVGRSQPDREFEETCEKLDSVARFLVAAEVKAEVPA